LELKTIGIEPQLVPDDAPGIAKGIIVEQTPAPSKIFDATVEKLKLHVAIGPTIAVPDLTGKSISAAQNLAKASKLVLAVAAGNPSQEGFTSPGQSSPGKCVVSPITAKVVGMNPAAGTLVFASTVITVTTVREIGKPLLPAEPCKCTKNVCILL
jgi:beta-lactam-binding protein with PASTA domain